MPKIRRAYKLRLKTNEGIRASLIGSCGAARFLCNKSLAMNLDRLEKGQGILWYHELAFWLRLWKGSEEYGFLRECPSQALQQKLRDLDRAFREGFYRSNPMEGKIKNITVSSRAGRWYASIRVEQAVDIGNHPSGSELGIDAGIRCFAAYSDGRLVEGVNSFRKHEDVLAREQRNLARKRKGSHNWKKQKTRISRLHHTISNVRSDFLHKLTTEISKSHAKVFVEGLHIRGMSASARGTEEDPGRNVRAKSGLNRSILDQGWFEFRRQLAYKLCWQGGSLVEVEYRYTSQRCSHCGYTAKENRKSQSEFVCLQCGHEQHADVNAAINILTVGQTGLVCGSNRKGDRKQEPAGNRKEVLPVAS